MSKTGKKRFDRRTMRSFAVSAVFAYDFILKEAAEAEKEKKKEAAAAARKKQPGPSDSIVINKVVGKGTRRRSKMTLLEYEEKYNGENSDVLKLLGYKKDDDAAEEPAEAVEAVENPFNTEEFIQDVLSSQLEEEGADEIIFADLPDYGEYLYPVVNGVIENIGEIDGYIGRNLTGWSIDRIKRTDLAVLRVAVFELVHFRDTVPLEIAINEAVEAAKSSDLKSGAFVNGVLAGVVRELNGEKK